ncbi:hypothetical protein HD553DRAFT_318365, partial [Filobasidium floriforme]|uniref:uncharacterized protein n=1 Tax=Filobasidium floriforme TaxID=5210 RepID=UPI001E8D1EBC
MTPGSVSFNLTLGIFDEAKVERKEVEVAVTYDHEALFWDTSRVPKPARLFTCISVESIPHGGNTSDLVWLLDAKQTWLGEKKGEKEALYAVNKVLAYGDPEELCSVYGDKATCEEELGDTKPGKTKSIDCGFWDGLLAFVGIKKNVKAERPEGLPSRSYPARAIAFVGPTMQEVQAYNMRG